MELFIIIVVAIAFLAIVMLHHPSTIKITDTTPEKIAKQVQIMLIQGKRRFVIEHDYKGTKSINKHYDIMFERKDIIDAICNVCPEDKININCISNTIVINVIEEKL
jgi:hypothetical protein